jgi:hypothetical protein
MRPIVVRMERNRKMPQPSQRATAKKAALELRPDRAFVLHLDVRARPPRRVAGRVEHITSGQVAHVTSLRELLVFLAEVLRNQTRGERETAYATLVLENCQSSLAARARDSLDRDAGRSAGPTLRGRKRGGES